ncbi:hypothetical protein B9Z19DRAFT_1126338 [Tuber borchii]|uniref:Uncharacterized protein n=1 Tax=Tuber borchii TaxID=42251 RepID=A0A2T6ZT28_TUBBO|nr:hypothetical protein B9Z19DRAFT_1126338 [Tuber borchii]
MPSTKYGSPIWDFHRASPNKVNGVEFGEVGGVCTVLLHDGRRLSADFVVVAQDEGYDRESRIEEVLSWVLKNGEQFNIVLLALDDIPKGSATTIEGNVDEMREIYND